MTTSRSRDAAPPREATRMLSKVLKDATAEVKPITWPSRLAPVYPPQPSPQPKPGADGEAAELRARIAELSSEIEQSSRKSYESGFRAGEAASRTSLAEEVRAKVEQLARTIDEVAGTRATIMRDAEKDTVRLAIEIARRILHRELSVDGSALEGLIKAALHKLQSQAVHRVRVNPEHEQIIRRCLEQAGRSQSVEVVSDPTQPEGGAVFEIGRGALDASIERQLEEIERGLTDQLEARS